MKQSIHNLLISRMNGQGLAPLNVKELDQFQAYYELLMSWNEKMNLTAITEPEEVCDKHFIDSLLFLPVMDAYDGKTVLDLGTGAGFPGIPLAIVNPTRHYTLVDSLQKRVGFLEKVVDDLGLRNVTCLHGRAELLAKDPAHRDHYDLGVARAVAKMPILLEYVMPFIRPQGHFIAGKGPDASIELKQAQNALQALKSTCISHKETNLPDGDKRFFLVFEKEALTPRRFPRKPGMGKKNPL